MKVRQSVCLCLVAGALVTRSSSADEMLPPAPPDLQVITTLHEDGGVTVVKFIREQGVKVVARPDGRGADVVADFVVVPAKERIAGPLDWRDLDGDPLGEEARTRIRKGQPVLVTRRAIPELYRPLFRESVVILRPSAK